MEVINDIYYNKLSFLKDYPDEIPESSGIYFWNYWPEFDYNNISDEDFIDLMLDYSSKKILFGEEINGKYKFKGVLYEQGFKENNNIFGLSDLKQKDFLDHLFESNEHMKVFYDFFKKICFSRAFYIGKAVNLRSRLSQHFKGQTNVLEKIDDSEIPYFNIWVGYSEIKENSSKRISNIYEEIFNRILKPGLTLKPN